MTKRREFLKSATVSALALMVPGRPFSSAMPKKPRMKPGLVTYQWGKDWDVPTIIRNCEQSDMLGVELRTEHKHGVEPTLTAAQRKEVKALFDNSRVTFIGYGSNVEFDSPDPNVLKENMDFGRQLVKLSHDIGGTGVKVKPNRFHQGVPKEKTIEQIGKSLNELGKFAADYGQKIRLEVHGRETQELPNMKAIMDVADHPNVVVCWNCNPTDLIGEGFHHNFNLVKDRLGDTIHIHELDSGNYPYEDLMRELVKMNYDGWCLWECTSQPNDTVAEMGRQVKLWRELVGSVRKS